MKTQEITHRLVAFGLQTEASHQYILESFAQARTDIDVFIADKKLPPLLSVAKLERLQYKIVTDLICAGVQAPHAHRYTRQLGLPTCPAPLVVAADGVAQNAIASSVTCKAEQDIEADDIKRLQLICKDGSKVSIAKTAFDELDADLFEGLRGIKREDNLVPLMRLNRAQLVAIREFAETDRLESTYGVEDLLLLRKAADYIGCESFRNAIIKISRERDLRAIQAIRKTFEDKKVDLSSAYIEVSQDTERDTYSADFSSKRAFHLDELLDECLLLEAFSAHGFCHLKLDHPRFQVTTLKFTLPPSSHKEFKALNL